jgi:hypothetical protein
MSLAFADYESFCGALTPSELKNASRLLTIMTLIQYNLTAIRMSL